MRLAERAKSATVGSSCASVAKTLSTTALSQQSPLRLMRCSIACLARYAAADFRKAISCFAFGRPAADSAR
jgi:hypothetical protein